MVVGSYQSRRYKPLICLWWARQDSNLQPDRYERPALTIELQAPPHAFRDRQRCRHRLQGRGRTGNAAVCSAVLPSARAIAGLDPSPGGQIRSPLDCRAVAPRRAATGRADAPSPWVFNRFRNIRNNACQPTQISRTDSPSCPTQRGVAQRHQRGTGMRWTRMAPLTKALEADGEVVWS
jgi:hypothetical protein